MSHIIDTHAHLDSDEFREDLDNVIEESRLCGVSDFIIPAASLDTLNHAIDIAKRYDNIYYALGIHPCCIDEIYDMSAGSFRFELLESKISQKCKAIGECGLDFFRLSGNIDSIKAAQIECFEYQIELALESNLPLILHVRDSKDSNEASLKVCDILRKYHNRGYGNAERLRGVFHCYNACEALLEFSDTFYYGIGGIVTFKNAQNLQEIVKKIPKDRILLETDAPYLAPIPHRGKRNESKYLVHVVDKLSELLNISKDEIERITSKNAKVLFGI